MEQNKKESYEKTAFYPADILLPQGVSYEKWAVVACDQFTSEPEYWEAVEETVGDEPSALRVILPEVRLADSDVKDQIEKINETMVQYLNQGLFQVHENTLFYLERTQSDGAVRKGLVGMVDLEQYQFLPGNRALIRATEGTVLSRIPPRVLVRQDAAIELPHVMLLIDDPEKTVIEPVANAVDDMEKLYDFTLQQGGGSIKAYALNETQKAAVQGALEELATSEEMERKYGLKDAAPLLFAVGDGNHSLATAKQCYENLKKVTPVSEWKNIPARYALVEVVNNHDEALKFEPIHRVLFGVNPAEVVNAILSYYPGAYLEPANDKADNDTGGKKSTEACENQKEKQTETAHRILYCCEGAEGEIVVPNPKMQLTVGTLQTFLDEYLQKHAGEVDYIHGDAAVKSLGTKPGNIGFLLPAMGKEELFKTVIADGVLPRKTFSMGHAQDKRYYIEARKIR